MRFLLGGLILLLPYLCYSQIGIPDNTPVVQNFDGMGTGTALPANWKMSDMGITANWTTASNFTSTSQAACNTAPTAGGRYNWGLAAACTDRAVGFMTSGSYSSPNSILSWYRNTSGSTATDITISFDIERYRINSTAFSLTFFTSSDGTTWTARTAGDVAAGVFATGASAYTFTTPQTTSRTINLTGINIASGSDLYLRWVFNNGGSNSQGIGIDNVSVTASVLACTMAAEPTVQSTGLSISAVTGTSLTLNWTRGNGANCIVVGRSLSAVTSAPADGSSYTANSIFGSGSITGSGQYVVYNGTGNSVVVTGLAPNTTYYFSVFEFNGSATCTNYLVSTPATGNSTTLNSTSYNYYRGNIHSHTAYSDGDMDGACPTFGSAATCCYSVANSALYFDFMGIADHNHNEGTAMTVAKYRSGINEAAAFNASFPNSFAALYGMEWGTISGGGHICVYGIDSLVGWNAGAYEIFNAKTDYNGLFTKIANTPNSFAYLAHPNTTDYSGVFTSAYNAVWDTAIVGISMENGPYNSTSTSYNDPPTGTPDEARYKDLLKIGYKLGPGIDLDNHNSATMGKSSQGRTVVRATSLTFSSIIDAYRKMRFYATEDYNVEVQYLEGAVNPLGSILSLNTDPVLSVSVADPDAGESVASIEIWYGVPGSGANATLLTSNTNSSTLTYTHAIAGGASYYYYAKVTQGDGHRIWTSPIWVTKLTPLPVELLSFNAVPKDGEVQLSWITASEWNSDHFLVERTAGSDDFTLIDNVPAIGFSSARSYYSSIDKKPLSGISYYRLRQVDIDGTSMCSELVPVEIDPLSFVRIYPNPFTDNAFYIDRKSETENEMIIRDLNGVSLYTFLLTRSREKITLPGDLPAAMYILEIRSADECWKFKLIKQ